MSRPRITATDVIDVDALPEWKHSRRQGRRNVALRRTGTIDLTNMDDDSDSSISILTSTPKPGASGGTLGVASKGKGREMNFLSPIGPPIDKTRKRRRTTPNSSKSQSYPPSVPPTKKMKKSSRSPASREEPTSGNNNNEPIASASGSSTLSLSDISLELSKGTLSQTELAKIAREMLSQLHQTSVPSSSRPTKMTRTAAAISSNSRRKDKDKRTLSCIELSSDGEEVDKKRQKRTAASSSNYELIAGPSSAIDFQAADMNFSSDIDDEESNYDHIHAGYDIHNPDIWTPMPVNLNRMQEDEKDEEVVNNMEQLAISKLEPGKHGPRYVHPDISRFYPSKNSCPPIFLWDELRLSRITRYPTRPRPIFLQPLTKPFTRPWDIDFNLHRLRAVHSFKESPGSINKVEQRGEWTVIASACTGGIRDTVDEELSPYNRPGSLITWRNRLHIPDGHQVKKGDNTKYYAVHDLKFFPNETSFVSTGADGAIRLWNLGLEDGGGHDIWFNERLHTFYSSPHDLAFKPNASILAVAEKKIHIFTFHDDQFEISADFLFHPLRSAHVIGSMAWGSESTKDQLFGSSEPCFSTVFEGIHKALDVATKRSLYQFDASEAGDMLSLDSTGGTLALSTRAPDNKHLLRIYDTRRRLPKATYLMELEPFPIRNDFEGEVNNASFSPDGVYLALARNDNRTHVYDRRMLDRGVLFEYGHYGESKAASQKDVYGVVKAQWVQSQATRRMALVTGGEDGCIRMWDPTKAAKNPENGQVLAEVNSDISHFSLGDPYNGENQLVVGDNTGEVTIFNNVVI